MKIDYEQAGVNIAAGNQVVERIKEKVRSTFSPHVLTGLGSFGALVDLKPIVDQYDHPVLVQSIDGVGTKTIVAQMMGKFDTLGIDLLSATCNDIVVLGAKPITFLDYIANETLNPDIVDELVSGMVKACIENEVSLVGGETAEMPNVYLPGEHDLVGIITGVVEKEKAITGAAIRVGDKIIGLASSGLHTNGFSLARKLFFDLGSYTVHDTLPEFSASIGETLLAPHINYTMPILAALDAGVKVNGMAHITGGGLLENVPRILPNNVDAVINKTTWPMLPVFEVMCRLGALVESEAYRTFNMGIGLTIVLPEDQVAPLKKALAAFAGIDVYEIGQIVAGSGNVSLISE